MPNALLKLLVKDKQLYSGKVCEEEKRNLQGEGNKVTADRRQSGCLKTPRRETEDYSKQGPTSTQS